MVTDRLVVADSQLLFADALAEALAARGHEVLAVCATCRELLGALRSKDPTVCLADPGLAADGKTQNFLAQLSHTRPDCRIVVLTADPGQDELRAVLESGVSGYLPKSRALGVLLDALVRVARGEVVVEASFMPVASTRLVDSAPSRALRTALTDRELQCLRLIVEGKDTAVISRELRVSRATVRSHVQAVLTKLGVHSRLEAAALAARMGLVSDALGEALNPLPFPASRRRAT